MSVWLGGLPALILLIGVGTIGEDTRHFAGAILRHFSRVVTVAMLIILATGGILTWYLVGNLPGMIGTLYGNLLSIKLALLAGVLLIAKSLQSQLLPALEIKPSDSVFLSYARRVKVETLLAVLIVFIASDMAGLSPPAHEDIVWPLHFAHWRCHKSRCLLFQVRTSRRTFPMTRRRSPPVSIISNKIARAAMV